MNLRVRTTGFSRSAMIAVGRQCQMIQTPGIPSRVARTLIKLVKLSTLLTNRFTLGQMWAIVKPKRLR